jgi:hypothetical protein
MFLHTHAKTIKIMEFMLLQILCLNYLFGQLYAHLRALWNGFPYRCENYKVIGKGAFLTFMS